MCGWMHLIALQFLCFCFFLFCVCVSREDATHQHHLRGKMLSIDQSCFPALVFVANPLVYCQQMNFRASNFCAPNKEREKAEQLDMNSGKISKESGAMFDRVFDSPRWGADRSTSRIAGCRSIICIVDIMHNGRRNLFDWRLYFGWYRWFGSSFST